jgi:hypothetical protein
MGRRPKEYKYVKKTDGRKNNGRKKGETYKDKQPTRATTSALNKAKKARVGIYALNAMKDVFGSEEAAWKALAEQALGGSFPHMKLLFEYKYGKPEDNLPTKENQKLNINIKNLFTGTQQESEQETIDITPEDE